MTKKKTFSYVSTSNENTINVYIQAETKENFLAPISGSFFSLHSIEEMKIRLLFSWLLSQDEMLHHQAKVSAAPRAERKVLLLATTQLKWTFFLAFLSSHLVPARDLFFSFLFQLLAQEIKILFFSNMRNTNFWIFKLQYNYKTRKREKMGKNEDEK